MLYIEPLIMDPTSPGMYPSVLASETGLGRDRFCTRCKRAYRSGKLLSPPSV